MLLDIVVLPPAKLRRKISDELKKATAGHSSVFVVDDTKLIPHLSLWHMRTSKKMIDGLMKELAKIVRTQKPIRIESAGFTTCKKPKECVEFKVKNSKALASLQQKVFLKTYSFKTGMMPPYKPLGVPTGRVLKEAKKYGRSLEFHPHFTWVY